MGGVEKVRGVSHWHHCGQEVVIVVGTSGENIIMLQKHRLNIEVLFTKSILVPINQKVPLWQAERVRAGCGPAVLQVQDDVWV